MDCCLHLKSHGQLSKSKINIKVAKSNTFVPLEYRAFKENTQMKCLSSTREETKMLFAKKED